MQAAMGASLLNLGAKQGLRRAVRAAARRCSPRRSARNGEIREMLGGVVRAASTPSSASASRVGKPLDLERFAQRAGADRAQLRPVPRPDARRCACRSRSSWSSSGACWSPSCASCSRTPAASSSCGTRRVSAQVDSQLRERRKASSAAARRSSGSRPPPASSSRASPRSRRRTSACTQFQTRTVELAEALREHAFAAPLATDAALVKLDLPLFDDAVPVRRSRGDAAPGLSVPRAACRPAFAAPRSSPGSARTAATRLPWQSTRDPYRVWLSEIMLQQTQVATVLAYYERFLAALSRRARARRRAARRRARRCGAASATTAARATCIAARRSVVAEHGGEFPRTQRRRSPSCPGIGRSTAAAIAAFCFGERVGDPRRQRQARADARARLRRRPGRGRRTSARCGARRRALLPARDIEAVHAGPDGPRRDRLPARARRAACSARCATSAPRARAGTPERYPVKTRRLERGRREQRAGCGCAGATRVWLVQRPRQRRLGRPVEPAGVRLDRGARRRTRAAGRARARRCRRSSTC